MSQDIHFKVKIPERRKKYYNFFCMAAIGNIDLILQD